MGFWLRWLLDSGLICWFDDCGGVLCCFGCVSVLRLVVGVCCLADLASLLILLSLVVLVFGWWVILVFVLGLLGLWLIWLHRFLVW